MQPAAAIKIQAFVEFMLQKQCYLSMQAAAVVIQLYWGVTVMMREQTDWYKTHRDSALTILKRRYLSMQAAAVVIQQYWGVTVMMREQTDWYKTHRDSALTIQRYSVQHFRASITIQATVRMYLQRQHYML